MLHTPVSQLSKGFRQRTALAQALVHDPEVVILDEPTTGLDPHQIVEIRALVRTLAATKTVILSTHILQEANALADRLIVVSGGRIVGQGTAAELLRQAGVRTTVSVALASPAEDAANALAGLSGRAGLRAGSDGRSFVLTEEDEGLAARVGALALERGWRLVELHRRPPTLEEAFLALTKRSGGHLHAAPAPPASGEAGPPDATGDAA
jgi:ABC-2 type transport system ATP-binding protein